MLREKAVHELGEVRASFIYVDNPQETLHFSICETLAVHYVVQCDHHSNEHVGVPVRHPEVQYEEDREDKAGDVHYHALSMMEYSVGDHQSVLHHQVDEQVVVYLVYSRVS